MTKLSLLAKCLDFTITDLGGGSWTVENNTSNAVSNLTNVEVITFDDDSVSAGSHEFVVTTQLDVVDADDGLLSLREAMALANIDGDADIISFDESVVEAGGLIRLTEGELELTSDITINGDVDGDGKADITITGDAEHNDVLIDGTNYTDAISNTYTSDNSRIFNITSGTANLDSLNLTGGFSDNGGAIFAGNSTVLNLDKSMLIGNGSSGTGGALSTVLGNRECIWLHLSYQLFADEWWCHLLFCIGS